MLVGRDRECALIDEVLRSARDGSNSTLLLRGEAGIGKSALLDHAARSAADMTLARASGVESESELQFGGLLELAGPLLASLPRVPEPQAAALESALGLGLVRRADRFAVGAATLSLLAAAAEEAPLLVLVDDAQWLDRSSLESLLFALRRLHADAVAALLAVRDEPGAPFATPPGMTELIVRGLDDASASLLLATVTDVPPPPAVAARLSAATGGNPLALLELPAGLTAAELSGTEPLREPLPAGPSVERAFAGRAAELGNDTRSALVVASVSGSTELDLLAAALEPSGLGVSALEPAEDAGLLRIEGGRIAFRHPLVRSAVFHAARPSERRAAHRALADALGRRGRDEERAWHLAAAALGPDEDAAAALAEAARRAQERSGFAATATAFERAARLTPDDELRAERFLEAAMAAWIAGERELGADLVQEALAIRDDPRARVRLLRGRGVDAWFDGRSGEAAALLGEAAALAEEHDPDEAVGALADAVEAWLLAGRADLALVAAARARTLAAGDGDSDAYRAEYALGMALLASDGADEAGHHLERALGMINDGADVASRGRNLLRAALGADALGRPPQALELAVRAVARAREQAAYTLLPLALEGAARLAVRCGRWQEAYGWATEALERLEAGNARTAFACLAALAWIDAARGNETHCRAHVSAAADTAADRELDTTGVEHALALLDAGLGRLEEAVQRYERLPDGGAGDPELVELCSRLGRTADASTVAEQAAGSEPAALHCRGLVADGDTYEPLLREAAGRYAAVHDAFGAARTLLALGERLRRAGRRVDGREVLREALVTFERLGAEPWAERARTELRASGERLRRREAHEDEELTPQELQIALQVAEGKTNKEVAAALFLSPKTIEFHLKRVFRKLGVRSRGELILRFASSSSKA